MDSMNYHLTCEHTKGGTRGTMISLDRPAPCVMAHGIDNNKMGSVELLIRPMEEQPDMAKPEWWDKIKKPIYAVPSMAEIAALPKNDYLAASTFSGCGGSSLGYKMAGFDVLWASEFIPAAQDTYRANHIGTILDTRDIRQVQPEDILKDTGLARGELDVFDGSPPCASFSTAGKREEGWNTVRKYSDTHQRVDDLFYEYTRLLKGLQPKIFIAENVSGLLKGVAKGYFIAILKELKACGYRVLASLIDAQWLGVPQSRQRVIFMGVRNDLKYAPRFPTPLRYRYSVREAIPWLADLRFTPHGPNSFAVPEAPMDGPAPTVLTTPEGGTWNRHDSEVYEAPIEGRAIEDTGGEWGMGDVTDRPAPTVRAGGVGHLVVETESDISRFAIGEEWNKLKPGEQSDKYFQLVKQDPDTPCQTVTAAGGNASIATVTHPFARRKFSIAELKRIGGFPDDFILTGTYAQSWERIGRAVPPVMMAHIARSVRGILDDIHGVRRDESGRAQ